MKSLILTIILLTSPLSLAISPLDPSLSATQTIDFVSKGRQYHIGTWFFGPLGYAWAMVTLDKSTDNYVFIGTITPLSEGDVERFGGIEAYIDRHLLNWNSQLESAQKEVTFPLWEAYTQSRVYFNNATGELVLDGD
jgi:hypothetical protein